MEWVLWLILVVILFSLEVTIVHKPAPKPKVQIQPTLPALTEHHRILGVTANVTPEQLKLAYRRLAQKYHPDRPEGDVDMFRRVQAAYDKLSKPKICSQCDGKGSIKVRRGALVDTVKCPLCWPKGV